MTKKDRHIKMKENKLYGYLHTMLQQTPANRGSLGSDAERELQNAPKAKDHRIHKRRYVSSSSLWGFFWGGVVE